MKKILNIGLAVLLIFGTAGCESDDDILGDITEDDIKVMTWNIYVGADTDPITKFCLPEVMSKLGISWKASSRVT